jgi:hypothetical protein
MSYHLWVSAATGRRRRGTSVSELRDIFNTRITTEVLFEPLKWCLARDRAEDVAADARRLDFDIVGVKQEPDQPVIGFVRRENLKEGQGQCEEFRESIKISDIVADSTPLLELLERLGKQQFVFVLAGSSIDGIVTRADLQKPPVRILLFSLISLLEMHLTYWITKVYPNESWKDQVSSSRLVKASELMEARKRRKEDISLVECLQLCDKGTVVEKSEKLLQILGFESKAAAKAVLKTVERVRDKLAHSQFDLKAGTSWQEIIALSSAVERSLELQKTPSAE